jgi:hypothetical protein
MKKLFKYLFIALLVCFVVPQIALASWWNPLSWGIWNIFSISKTQNTASAPTAKIAPTTATENNGTSNSNSQTINTTETSVPNPPTTAKNNQSNQQQSQNNIPSKVVKNTASTPVSTNTPVQPNLNLPINGSTTGATIGNMGSTSTPVPASASIPTIITPNPIPTSALGGNYSAQSSTGQTYVDLQGNVYTGTYVNVGTPQYGINWVLTQVTTCKPNWQCSGWSGCLNSQQIRTCDDKNHCNVYTQEPSLTQSCSMPQPIMPMPLTVSCKRADSQNGTNQEGHTYRAFASGGNNIYYYTWASNVKLYALCGTTTKSTCYFAQNEGGGDYPGVNVQVESGGQIISAICD